MIPNFARFLRDDDFWWMAAAVVVLILLFAAAVDRQGFPDFFKGFGRLLLDAVVRPVRYLAGGVREIAGAEGSLPGAEKEPSHWLDQLLRLARGALLVLVALSLVSEGRAIWRTLTLVESSEFMIPHTRNRLESARSRLVREEENLKRLKENQAGMTPTPYANAMGSQIRYAEQSVSSSQKEVQELETQLRGLEDKSWHWMRAFRETRDFLIGLVSLLWFGIFVLEWTAMVNGISKDLRFLREGKENSGK